MSKTNLLYLIESSETGGAEQIFLRLVENADRARYTLHVGLFSQGWLFNQLVERGIVPVVFATGRYGYDLNLFLQLYRYIKKRDIQLVCAHLFSASLYAGVAGRLLGVPVVGVFHGTMDVSEHDRRARIKFRILNRCLKKYVYVSHYLRKYFEQNFYADPNKSQIIYNGIDLQAFQQTVNKSDLRRQLGISEKEFLLIAIGDLRPAKDYPTLLRAVAEVVKFIPAVKLIIAGTKTSLYSELDQLRGELCLQDTVQFLGYRNDIRQILSCADMYVSSSRSEGFSLTVVEAMAAGIPVVATMSGGPMEIIQHGVTGYLVPLNNPQSMAQTILSLLSDKESMKLVANNGIIASSEKFGVGLMITKYNDILCQCCLRD